MPGRLSPAEETLLRRFLDRLLAAAPPGSVRAVRVFGSRARGASGPHSDLDVAVEVTEAADRRHLSDLAADAAWEAMWERDLVELGLAPIVLPPGPAQGLRAAILRDGLTLWERPSA